MKTACFDVVIVGAGLSGIGAARHLQTKCPTKSFVILEGRERLGGTWDLFRYPGIRSDSDMYTLGYSFRPWSQPKAIADGPSILTYLRETAEASGIDRKIRYRHRVERARWSTSEGRWTLDVRDGATGRIVSFQCRFLLMCAGYYDYEAGYTPDFDGRERFGGRIVHPQQWTDDIEYAAKRVVVIGSGATAMTLVPALAKHAAHVTMLQRSPTYVVSRPAHDALATRLHSWLPAKLAYGLIRLKNVLLATAFYRYCRRFPDQARRLLVGEVRRAMRGKVDVEKHFTPRYKPWDQRLCLVPDGDLFEALGSGRASVVTDQIAGFTETGVRLASGDEIAADLVVTATGLRLKLLGGIALDVDGKGIEASDTMLYKGAMLSDVPNFALSLGYTNASWTLKCELTIDWVCRVLEYMDRHGYTSCRPRANRAAIAEEPLMDLSSGYVRRAAGQLPRQGAVSPWRTHQNYLLDTFLLKYGRLADSVMEFTTGPKAHDRPLRAPNRRVVATEARP
jgi:cation diffusion facilitator CzcD-associated flavoprotein CzcO